MHDSRETSLTRAFVSGYPIKHSRSPLIHNHWLQKFHIRGEYALREIEPSRLATFLDDIRSGREDYAGGNFSIPHKEAVCRLADVTDELAREIGAANTVWMENGRLHATNTDAYGFSANLDEQHPQWDQQKIAVIYGAGGASRAVIQAVRDRGFTEIHVLNRTLERARELADRFGDHVHDHPLEALRELLVNAGLFVNTTSLSMKDEDVPTIDFSGMAKDALVTDVVYIPMRTRFLAQAEEQGLATADGLGMLLHQAVRGFEKWFGVKPTVDQELRLKAEQSLENH